MSAVLKSLIICICINIMMTLSSIFVGGSDVITQFVSINNNNGVVTPTSQFNLLGNNSLPTDVSSGVVGGVGVNTQATGSQFTFIDPIKLTFKFLLLILISLFLPVYWGFALALPLWFTLLLLVETIIGVTAIILAIRGVPA